MAPDAPNLEEQLAQLRSRIWHLEQTLRAHGMLTLDEQPQVPPAPDMTPAGFVPSPQLPAAPGLPQVVPPATLPLIPPGVRQPVARKKDSRSLESRIGSEWFNRIGILAVLIGMAWFLKLAIDNHWIGPLGRVLVGLIAGAGLVAWSERIRNRGYPGFSYSLKALGSGILYLSLWAAFSLFHLIPAAAAFAAMVLVTAFNGFMSWLQNSELLALYAIVGGLSVPILVSTGENHEVALFSYLLLLDVAVLVLVALRPWSRLLFGAFLGTVLLFTGWWIANYTVAWAATTAWFITGFFLIFAFGPRLVRLSAVSSDPRMAGWDALAIAVLPMSNAALGFFAFYLVCDGLQSNWADSWVAVGFAAFYLFMLRLPARGKLHPAPPVLSALHLTAAVVFLSLAIPLKTRGRWLTIGWLVEGAALLWFAAKTRSGLLRALGVICLALGLTVLVLVNPPASTTPFFNERFATYCVAMGACAFAFFIARRVPAVEDQLGELRWHAIAAATVLIMNALILLAIGWEIHSYWWTGQLKGDWRLIHEYQIYAQFTYSAFFMAFGALLLGLGFWRRSAFLRWQALLLLAVAIGKVFLVDVSQLSQGYRVLSFIGLGGLLLAVSFVYQRDLLHLRKPEPPIS